MLSYSKAAAAAAEPAKPKAKREAWVFGAAIHRDEEDEGDLASVSEFQLVDDDVISVADTESIAPSIAPSRCNSSMSFDMLQLDDDAASVFSDMSVISRAVTPAINIPARASSWAYMVAKDKVGASSSLVTASAMPVSEYITETDQLVEDEADDIVNNLPSATYGDDDELYDDDYDDYDDGYGNDGGSVLGGVRGGGGKKSRKEVNAENEEKMKELREKMAKIRAISQFFKAKNDASRVAHLKAVMASTPAPLSSGASKFGLKRSKIKVK